MKEITLYCDGSSLGNPGFGGWCAILCYQNTQKVISGGERSTTNNRMELKAVIEGLKALKEPCEVKIVSDSNYVCDGINKWLKNWIAKDFKEVKNPDLWREYVNIAKSHSIKATWVKGHSGHKENDECDKIAKNEASKFKDSAESGMIKSDKLFDLKDKNTKQQIIKSLDSKKPRKSTTSKVSPKKSSEKNVSKNVAKSESKAKSPKKNATKKPTKNLSAISTDLANYYDNANLRTDIKVSSKIKEMSQSVDNSALQNRINYHFKDENLLLIALTHKSFDRHKNNERLEFLGDAVLDLIIGEYVFRRLPHCNEGALTKIRASIVNEMGFTKLANAIELGKYIFISNSESHNNGRKKPSILSDAFEALVGAIYIDGGLEWARFVTLTVLECVYSGVDIESLFVDYKTALQELTQAICGDLPEYHLISSSGPDHNKSFTMKVLINAQEFATAHGKSKKEAEQICAKIAYNRIKQGRNGTSNTTSSALQVEGE